MLVAKATWAKHLLEASAIYFIDNDSARLALVKGYSPLLSSLSIILECVEFDVAHHSRSWYSRVASPSNPGDSVSRMDKTEAVTIFGASVVRPVLPMGIKAAQVLTD